MQVKNIIPNTFSKICYWILINTVVCDYKKEQLISIHRHKLISVDGKNLRLKKYKVHTFIRDSSI